MVPGSAAGDTEKKLNSLCHCSQVLHWADKNADRIVPLYCFDPRHYAGTYHHDFPKTGPHRLKFLLQTVTDLRNNLLRRGR